MADSPAPCSNLAAYIKGRKENWGKNRQPLEQKWQRNTDAFKSVSTNFWKKGEGEDWRSKTFYNVTKTKVLAAFALVSDMLLQGSKIPFALSLSPWSMIDLDTVPEVERYGVEEAIEDQQRHIEQQCSDCGADKVLLKNIMAGAMLGESYAKRTVRQVVRRGWRQVSYAPPGMPDLEGKYLRFEPWEATHQSPAWEYVSCWDVFRDLESDDLITSAGWIHRDFWSPFDLRGKMGLPMFLERAIDSVLSEAGKEDGLKGDDTMAPGLRELKHRDRTIEVLEFWGRAPRKYVEEFEQDEMRGQGDGMASSAGNSLLADEESRGDDVEIMAVWAKDRIVRFARVKAEDRPLYRAAWEERLDDIGGYGVADNLEDVQKVLNGAIRGFEDNKRLSGDVVFGYKEQFADGTPEICPGKPFKMAEECDDIRKAVQQLVVQDVGSGYLEVIRIFERMADVVSMIPQISQGVRPEKSADTAYELSQLLENAGKYLGTVIRNYDQGLIEPIITGFYNYNMMDPDAPGKGDFVVKAQGFSSFQARVVRVQKLMRLLALVMQYPELQAEAKPRLLLEEIIKAEDSDPDIFLKSKRDKQEEAEQAAAAAQEQAAAEEESAAKALAMDQAAKDAEHKRKMELEAQKAAGKVIGDLAGRSAQARATPMGIGVPQ